MDQAVLWALARHCEPDTFGRFALKSYEFLRALRVENNRFANLAAVTVRTSEVVPNHYADFKDLLKNRVFGRDDVQDFFNLGEDGSLQDESLNRIGFSVTCGSCADSAMPMLSPEAGGVRMVLQGVSAGNEPNAQAIVHLPCDQPSEIHNPGLVRSLLELLIDKWECDVAGAYLLRYQRQIRSSDRASYAGQWLYYLPFPALARCLPPDIRHEPFANGILIETTPHMPDANNPADIAAGNRVRDVLDEFGLVNDATYAIEGWPPDHEESLYEQFISGAPADRKYTVHCINFDGYDPDRKVLLYAKLFRRLKRHPKEWGLRGWDGPVLNEAKRQVRAAAKAGGVPIEWHIGLEEPAHQVRQLLTDYTNITAQQLRVIYTPLEEALRRQT